MLLDTKLRSNGRRQRLDARDFNSFSLYKYTFQVSQAQKTARRAYQLYNCDGFLNASLNGLRSSLSRNQAEFPGFAIAMCACEVLILCAWLCAMPIAKMGLL